MDRLLLLLLGILRSACRSRADLMLENAALQHQLGVLMRASRRSRVTAADRWFWVVLRGLWSRWSEALVFVKPETVVRWHPSGCCADPAIVERRRHLLHGAAGVVAKDRPGEGRCNQDFDGKVTRLVTPERSDPHDT